MKLSSNAWWLVSIIAFVGGCSWRQTNVKKQEPGVTTVAQNKSSAEAQNSERPLGSYAAEQTKTRAGIVIRREAEREKSFNFAVNSADIDPMRAKAALEDMHRKITELERKEHIFLIAGHADQRGSHELNDKLSQARADAVKMALVKVYGISDGRLVTHGYGKHYPCNPANNEYAWEQNRRVELWDLTLVPEPYSAKVSSYHKVCE